MHEEVQSAVVLQYGLCEARLRVEVGQKAGGHNGIMNEGVMPDLGLKMMIDDLSC